MTEHLSEVTVAAYIDRRLPPAERRAAEAHLAECAACRTEIVDVTRLIGARRRVPRFVVPLAAAALLAAVALGINQRFGSDAPVLRTGTNESGVLATAPADQQVVSTTPTLAWRSVANASQYRVTITTSAGDIVTEKLIGDTTIVLQPLTPGTTFNWYVTAILRDGVVESSLVRSFRTQ